MFTRHELNPSITKAARSYRIARVPSPFFQYAVTIETDGKSEHYAVCEHFPDTLEVPVVRPLPTYFLVAKCGAADGEIPYLVGVSLNAAVRHSCTCFGYNRWQWCKHIDAFHDMLLKGLV